MLQSLFSKTLARTISLSVMVLLAVSASARPPSQGISLQELMDVEKSVQSAMTLVEPSLVALETAEGAATGVVVTADGLILTAAHVATDLKKEAKPGRAFKVTFTNGKVARARSLGFDLSTDAAMLRLEGSRTDWPCATLQTGGIQVHAGDWCFALGHPGGRDAARGAVLRMGKVLKIGPNTLQTDCVLMGGDSGGPLFNLQGELVGIHSQIWEDRDQNVHVSLAPFLRSWDALANSEVVRVWERGAGGWLGVATRDALDGGLEVDEVAQNSPAQRAGLRSGDRLVSFDRQPLNSAEEFSNHVKSRAAGDSIVLVVRNKSGDRIVTLKLGQQPSE